MLSAIYLWRLVLFCLFFVDISRQIFLKIHKSQVPSILTRSGDKVKIQKSDKNICLLSETKNVAIYNFNINPDYDYTYFISFILACEHRYFISAVLNCRQGKTMLTYLSLFRQDSLELSSWDMPLTLTQQINWFVLFPSQVSVLNWKWVSVTKSILINKF